ncbi:hypothetical protein L3Q82_020101 [Xyrichtys novacula]|uniref:B30.2/SPRY domain-containing protein n=1 Tax=Xyrichtys novacula TaxID=13765 RepID=A0AAV1EVW8_XYRNO|nr:hypothetical protein L3Q82_020101 [Xyrichtys novacula]
MVAHFRDKTQQENSSSSSSSSSEQQESKPEEVPQETEAEIQQMIQKRQEKIQEIKHSVDLSNKNADREMAEGVRVFSALKESVERGQAELMDFIKEKQKRTEKQAQDFIKELEGEISELMKRSSGEESPSCSTDSLKLLQSVRSMIINHRQPTRNWTEVNVHPPSYEGTVVRAVVQLEEALTTEMKKLVRAELNRIQQYEVDVTLDPDTAHPRLILSDDGKEVSDGDVGKNLPDNPERFSLNPCVLGKQSFSSGRFYYEVQVLRKTEWDLGVASESISRKADTPLCPEEGYWSIWLRKRIQYRALDDPPVRLLLRSRPMKVGVFVDYEEGVVSFYDVHTPALLYSFTGCSFSEKLFPYFNPGLSGVRNFTPLIISPVNQVMEIELMDCIDV